MLRACKPQRPTRQDCGPLLIELSCPACYYSKEQASWKCDEHRHGGTSLPSDEASSIIESRCCPARIRACRFASSQVRPGSYPDQGLEPLLITLLITFSWRFLLILIPARTKGIIWEVVLNRVGYTAADQERKEPMSSNMVIMTFSNEHTAEEAKLKAAFGQA